MYVVYFNFMFFQWIFARIVPLYNEIKSQATWIKSNETYIYTTEAKFDSMKRLLQKLNKQDPDILPDEIVSIIKNAAKEKIVKTKRKNHSKLQGRQKKKKRKKLLSKK